MCYQENKNASRVAAMLFSCVLFCSVKGTLYFHPQVFKAEARQILLIVQKVSVSGASAHVT